MLCFTCCSAKLSLENPLGAHKCKTMGHMVCHQAAVSLDFHLIPHVPNFDSICIFVLHKRQVSLLFLIY